MPALFLAANDEMTPEQYRKIIVASLIIIVLVVAAFVAVTQVRRRLRAEDDTTSTGGLGFTLSDLRQLHKQGQMSDEEFERAKAKIVDASKRAMTRRESSPADAIRDRRQARAAAEVEDKPLPGNDADDAPPIA